MRQTYFKKGISLIVLVITIIVIIILAGAVILSLANNNPIAQANEASFKSSFDAYQSELSMYIGNQYAKTLGSLNPANITATKTSGTYDGGKKIQEIITSMTDADASDYMILEGKLVYIGSDTNKRNWTKSGPLQTSYVTDGLILWLDGKDFTNTPASQVWVDRSGNNNHVTQNGFGYTTASGNDGLGSVNLDGNDDSFILPFVPTQSFTVSVNFKKSDVTGDGWCTIIGGPGGFELEARNGASTSPELMLYSWGGALVPYNLNEWVHVDFTRTPTDTKLYVNGVLKATGSAGGIPNGTYFIGAWNTANSQNFKGLMNNFMMYNKALTQAEITQNYNVDKARIALP